MTDTQAEVIPRTSTRKWVALAIGGGCALVACMGLVTTLAVSLLMPNLAGQLRQFLPGGNATPAADSDTSGINPAYPQQDGSRLGDPHAPVKMIEYGDFQCPYCRMYWKETEPRIIESYVLTGKVYYEYRSVGAFIGPESAAAAEAAYCAGDQGKFWQYHATLFSHWTGENAGDFTRGKLLQYGNTVGLDAGIFYECVDSGKYAQRVEQDAQDAQSVGVHATPSFLINGKLVEGALPFDALQSEIEAALQQK